MSKVLFGLETEYAFTPFGTDGTTLDRTRYSQRLVALAGRSCPSLYGRNRHDLFLGNGGRFYVDSGLGLINIEYSTPECTSPEELIGHVRAGDRLLAKLARQLEREHEELQTAFISKTNFDYSGHTSGSHENYLHTLPQSLLAPHLIPHLVSRVIYTGGGGFNDRVNGIEFMLSPRVAFLEYVSSPGAQSRRAIFTTKEEPLSDATRYGRLHLLCGEGVRFDMAEYLRLGVTSLLVKLVDLGEMPALGIELDPLQAINLVARDVHCREMIGRINGVPATAIDIQRQYLKQVRRLAGHPRLPEWTDAVCTRWEVTLNALASDPTQLVGVLDWPTKLALYRDYAKKQGFEWAQLTQEAGNDQHEIRAALFELDVRFGDISEGSLYSSLESCIAPGHRLVPETVIASAQHSPPQGTRAKLRGHWIGQLTQSDKRNRSSRCDWDHISDEWLNFHLDLRDPFASEQVRP